MKVSRLWLQNYFEDALPSAERIADALTFHAFEIEGIEHKDGDEVLDVKVLPDRAAYALSHRGVAREVGASLGLDMAKDPLHEQLPDFEKDYGTDAPSELKVEIEDLQKAPRYMGALVRGVKVGPSPEWLKTALESVGQRSINNVVDATNYVMLDIGQPLHAFDAANLTKSKSGENADGTTHGSYSIKVRSSYEGEKITTLSGDEFTLPADVLLITDANSLANKEDGDGRGAPIGIAGVKGGKAAQITERTKDIIIESANFNPTLVRKASQKLKLWTDASVRYQNKPSPLLTAYGMRDVLELITSIAGGEVVCVTDVADAGALSAPRVPVPVTLAKISAVLGTPVEMSAVARIFDMLGLPYTLKISEGLFTVIPPFERRDILIPEDLVEEVGRILGYDHVLPELLPDVCMTDGNGTWYADQARFRGIERIKDFLIDHCFSEISTQTFSEDGDRSLANPLDQTRPALRTSLSANMIDALARAKVVAPRVLGPAPKLKLFEIGTVFGKDTEHLSLVLGYEQLIGKKKSSVLDETVEQLREFLSTDTEPLPAEAVVRTDALVEIHLDSVNLEELSRKVDEETEVYSPKKISLGTYKPFSLYPFALRDIAVWTPAGTEETEVSGFILGEAGELLVRIDLFDRFEKKEKRTDGAEGAVERISFAFRLVFESMDRTLSDEDLNPLMEKITHALNAKEGFEVR